MSFYITLPSNSSMDIFPDNTLTSFTTKLKSALQLEGRYEVALTEIMFPVNWKFRKDGQIIVTDLISKKFEKFDIRFYAFDSVQELFNSINDFMKKKSIPIVFYYNKLTFKASLTIQVPWYIDFTDDIHKEFGFTLKSIQAMQNATSFHAINKIPDVLNPINSLYIYSDIVEHQFVGDEVAPLLRVVAVTGSNNYGEIVNRIFTSPHYIPVSRNYIETIRLDIRDDTGEKIQFSPGKVLIKLHFKPFYGL